MQFGSPIAVSGLWVQFEDVSLNPPPPNLAFPPVPSNPQTCGLDTSEPIKPKTQLRIPKSPNLEVAGGIEKMTGRGWPS